MLDNKFLNEWAIWFSYVGDPSDSPDNYHENISLIYLIATPSDLAYLWQNSPLCLLDNYFAREDLKQKCYQVDEKWRKVNSIEFFKKGIQPKWEDPLNQNGGRFIFSVNKSQENKQDLYSSLVFFLIGQHYDHSEKINGLRFINSKNPLSISYRVEIWVAFDNDDMPNLQHFKTLLTKLFEQLGYESKMVRFNNNKVDQNKDSAKDGAK